jgi:EF hand domain-containing protein
VLLQGYNGRMRTLLIPLALVISVPALAQSQPQPSTSGAATPTQQAPAQQAPVARRAAAGSTVPPADPAAARRLFRELDRNGDGYLSDQELWSERGRQDNWAAVDRNRDGRITPDEFTVIPAR